MANSVLPYKAYTREFDVEIEAAKLLSPSAEAIRKLHKSRKDSKLSPRFPIPAHFGARALITLLIDHSGSMKGERAVWVAEAMEIVGQALEHAGIEFEVLGFTTTEWLGGKSRAKWEEDGKPPLPGRLNDLLHIVYKDAKSKGTAWIDSLALLFDEKILKENIDGEALLWAAQRAEAINPSYWLCVAISDGAPVDDYTLYANNEHLTQDGQTVLTAHLKQVLEELDQIPNTEFAGVSFEYDATEYYPIGINVSPAKNHPSELLDILIDVSAGT